MECLTHQNCRKNNCKNLQGSLRERLSFSMERIIFQGAEAVLIQDKDTLIKRRIIKKYRHPDIDSRLRKIRNRKEAKLLEKSSEVINVPRIISVDEKNTEIVMEFIKGKKLSDELDKMENSSNICYEIGKATALLHNQDIIHGDLTTSNMIFSDKLYFIDFGLGFISSKAEDKAVDLHLLKQAFESKHFEKWEDYYKNAIKGYKESCNQAEIVIKRLEKVEERGRYKKKKKAKSI